MIAIVVVVVLLLLLRSRYRYYSFGRCVECAVWQSTFSFSFSLFLYFSFSFVLKFSHALRLFAASPVLNVSLFSHLWKQIRCCSKLCLLCWLSEIGRYFNISTRWFIYIPYNAVMLGKEDRKYQEERE